MCYVESDVGFWLQKVWSLINNSINNKLVLHLVAVQPASEKAEDAVEEHCDGDTEQLPQSDQAECESVMSSHIAPPADTGETTTTACNGSVDSGIGTGCRSSFASGDRLTLTTLTSSDKLSTLTCGGSVCSPVDEQQSPMSSTSSFLMPTPTTEEMCDDWSLMSDNKSDGGETATGISHGDSI